MGGATPILLKVVLFRLSGRGNSNDDATPSFDPDSNSFILGLSNEILFVSEFFFGRWSKQSKHKSENLLSSLTCPRDV